MSNGGLMGCDCEGLDKRIQELEKENARLREALNGVECNGMYCDPDELCFNCELVRQALEENK